MISQLTQRWKGDSFWRNSVIFSLGSMLVGALNYAYYPIMGRLLDIQSFGEVQTLISIYLQIGVVLSSFSLVATNILVVEKDGEGDRSVIELEKFASILLGLVLLISLLLVGNIQSYLHFESRTPILILLCLSAIGIPITFRNAKLQSIHDFFGVSIGGMVMAGLRLLFSAILVAAGMKTFGAMTGILIAYVVTLTYLLYRTNHNLKRSFKRSKESSFLNAALIKRRLKFSGAVLAISFITTLFYNLDTIFVKHYFSPETAGLYAGMSVISGIIFFVIAPLTVVLFSSAGNHKTKPENIESLYRSLKFSFAVIIPIMVVLSLFPRQVTVALIGSRYLEFSYLLPRIGLSMSLVSINYLTLFFLLAMRDRMAPVIALIGISIALVGIQLSHDSPGDIVSMVICGSIFTLLLLLAWGKLGGYSRHEKEKATLSRRPGL